MPSFSASPIEDAAASDAQFPGEDKMKVRRSSSSRSSIQTSSRGSTYDPGSPPEAVPVQCALLASRLSEVGRAETTAEDSKISDEVFMHTGTRRRMRRRESMTEILGQQQGVFGQGAVFGDHELLVDSRCSSTLLCDKDCQLLYIERSDFDRVVKEDLMRLRVQELNMQVRRLLHGFPLFADLAPAVQEAVPEIVHYSSHPRGSVVFREGDEPECCYIILSGEVVIFKKRSNAIASGELTKNSDVNGLPPLSPASPETYERCTQLAAKLAPVSSCLRPKTPKEVTIADLTRDGSVPVATIGPGFLFGDMGLLNSNPRNATAYCRKNCEFLAVENSDFDRVLKREMARTKDEKLEFLRTYVPGMRALPERMVEGLLHHFDKKTVPLNHVFLEQGEVADGSIYFVWQGSVEFYTQTGKSTGGFSLLPGSNFRRLRMLIKGGVFGAVPVDMRVPFTAVARSAPCEVLHITMQHLKQLPEHLLRGVRKLLDQTLVWTSENCSPVTVYHRGERGEHAASAERRLSFRDSLPSPSAPPRLASAHGRGNSASLPSLSKVSRLQSSKIPRPLSGKIPRPLDVKSGFAAALARSPSSSGATTPTNGSDKLGMNKTWGGCLFQRRGVEAASEPFPQTGDLLESKNLLKGIMLHKGHHMGKTLSLPAMRRAPDSGPLRTPERGQETGRSH